MNNPRPEKEFDHQAKKEGDYPNHHNKFPKFITSSSSSIQYSSLKNPRIVRVSRTCGGKDRHSKVCTVKGLRDRRIRLSVPTAIQLYNLQDRLGLNQPSKVVDWLINATQNEIDKLPPLPDFPQLIHQEPSSLSPLPDFPTSNNQYLNEQSFFPLNNNIQSSIPNMPYNMINWDHNHHPNLSLSQFGDQGYNSFSFSSQIDVFPNIPSNNIFPPFSTQIMENINTNDHQIRQINNHFQQNSILPTTLHLKSFSLDEINSKSVDKDKRNS